MDVTSGELGKGWSAVQVVFAHQIYVTIQWRELAAFAAPLCLDQDYAVSENPEPTAIQPRASSVLADRVGPEASAYGSAEHPEPTALAAGSVRVR